MAPALLTPYATEPILNHEGAFRIRRKLSRSKGTSGVHTTRDRSGKNTTANNTQFAYAA